MLVYDHDRTEQIVDRLRAAERLTAFATGLSSMAVFAAVGGLTGGAVRSVEGTVVGGIIGAVVGVAVGQLSMVLVSAVIDWMCQVLIALGEGVEAARRDRRKPRSDEL